MSLGTFTMSILKTVRLHGFMACLINLIECELPAAAPDFLGIGRISIKRSHALTPFDRLLFGSRV